LKVTNMATSPIMGRVATATGTPCDAWALLPTHGHLLLRAGAVPLTTVMRGLLTGYAGAFNRRHGDARILGGSEFVEAALLGGGEVMERRYRLQNHGYDFDWLLHRVAAEAGLPPLDLGTPRKVPGCVR
jgi:hypothetical protein